MSLDTKHPAYQERIEEWEQQRDSHKGEKAIKARTFRYLSPTSSMVVDGIEQTEQDGWKAYQAYLKRARYPELVGDAVETMLGVMHSKPPTIELPAAMEPLLERATLRRESLEALLRRINEEQLSVGRLGLLAEVPDGGDLPMVALYQAEDVINWDDGNDDDSQLDDLRMVVIDESENERVRAFDWEHVDKYRVLSIGEVADRDTALEENEVEANPIYRAGVFREKNTFSEDGMLEPNVRGRTLDRIPFVFVNTKDVVTSPDEGPLLSLSNLSLTIYRGEADYRQAIHEQGQGTLVTIGVSSDEDEPRRVGSGAEINIPTVGGDAKYIGIDSNLAEMRTALENDYARGAQRAEGLLEAVSRSAESGEALRVRVSARTASLNQVALTGAFALQEILRMIAVWIGANPDEVIVVPNLDFVGDLLKGRELVDIQTAKELGAPISQRTIHELAQERGLTTRTFDEELEEMAKEFEEGVPGSVMMGEDRKKSQTAATEALMGAGDEDPNENDPGQGGAGEDDDPEEEA